jgi:hypothetical protein
MTRLIAVATILTLLGTVGSAWTWGDAGHKIVCEIASHELNDKARAEVGRLIATDPEGFASFADSCIWPDHPKKRRVEHFINVPRNFTTFTSNTCPPGDPCLVSAIEGDLAVLTGGGDDDAKLASLKFFGHWVGDIHQPLQVSFADDLGGNKIKDTGPCKNNLHILNLHAVWDVCIIEQTLGNNPRDIGAMLQEEITDAERAKWQGPVSEAHTWANESLVITRHRDVNYCVNVGSSCRYRQTRTEYHDGEPEKTTRVDMKYIEAHGVEVRERLKQAGVRLANLLNLSLGR